MLVYEIHKKTGKNHIYKLFPVALIIQAELIQVNLEFYQYYTLPLLLVSILLYGLVSSKFITMNISKSNFLSLDTDVFYYFMSVIFCCIVNDFVYVGWALLSFFIFLKFKYVNYVFSVTLQIMKHLNIRF